MIASTATSPDGRRAGRERIDPTETELRAAYEAYRLRQARALIALVPREAIRPLYRSARERHDSPSGPDDPLGLLANWCLRLMPLPPFDVWADDYLTHRDAHMAELGDAVAAPSAEDPVTLEARRLHGAGPGGPWVARLRGYRDGDAWRGFIAFGDDTAGIVHTTAPIFCEGDPRALRSRFLDFESEALEAFLRSCRP